MWRESFTGDGETMEHHSDDVPTSETANPINAMARLRQIIVCPLCKGTVEIHAKLITCVTCWARFSQSHPDCVDLLPSIDGHGDEAREWAVRQQKMDLWYRDLCSRPAAASQCFDHDYTPYAPDLAGLRGLVLDIGGGKGIVRHYLPPDAGYVNLEPSLAWLDPDWAALTDDFPCLSRSLPFVKGLGETLPFAGECFDTALSFWSLNHARHPQAVFREAHRVLKPAGRFLVVLEDMEPRWIDLIRSVVTRQPFAFRAKDCARKVVWNLRGKEWPLQDDHIRITEPELEAWVAGRFAVVRRWWIKRYLNLELKKL